MRHKQKQSVGPTVSMEGKPVPAFDWGAIGEAVSVADIVPAGQGWFTVQEYMGHRKLRRARTQELLHEAVARGRLERRRFMGESGYRQFYYRLPGKKGGR